MIDLSPAALRVISVFDQNLLADSDLDSNEYAAVSRIVDACRAKTKVDLSIFTRMSRFFVLRLPNARRMFLAGGVWTTPSSEDHSFSGAGADPGSAIAAGLGELCEQIGLYDPPTTDLMEKPGPLLDVDDLFKNAPRGPFRVVTRDDGGECACALSAALCSVPSANTSSRLVPLSEGTGAGETIEAAKVHGVLELIERDAYMLWWRGGRPARQIDILGDVTRELDTSDYASVDSDTALRLLDITTDAEVPCVAALSWRHSGGGFACGTAARLTRSEAILAAVRELRQLEFGAILSEMKRDQSGAAALSPVETARLDQMARFCPDEMALCNPAETIEVSSLDPSQQRKADLSAAADKFDVHYCDLSPPDLGISVVKCISPLLQPGTSQVRRTRLRSAMDQWGGTDAQTGGLDLV